MKKLLLPAMIMSASFANADGLICYQGSMTGEKIIDIDSYMDDNSLIGMMS